jgi:GGDEF domain-containing protein
MSFNSETVLGRFVRRVESQYQLPEFSRRAWPVLLAPGSAQVDGASLATICGLSDAWTNSFLKAVQHPLWGAATIRDASASSLAKIDRQVLAGLFFGFGLPGSLYAELPEETVEAYWQRTLIRSVAIYLLSKKMVRLDGDGLFAAAMVADMGSLVLLRELKQTYVQFIKDAEQHGQDVHQMEMVSLGFDQRVLAARLLDRWSVAEQVTRIVGSAAGAEDEVPSSAQAGSLSADNLRSFVFQAGDLLSELFGGRLSEKRARGRVVRLIRISRQVFGWTLSDLAQWANDVVKPAQYLADCFDVGFGEPSHPGKWFDEIWNEELRWEFVKETPIVSVPSASTAGAGSLANWGGSSTATATAMPELASAQVPFFPPSNGTVSESQDWRVGSGVGTLERGDGDLATRTDKTNRSATVANEPISVWLSDHLLSGQVQNAIELCRSRRESLSLKLVQIDQFESLLFGGSIDEVYQVQQRMLLSFEQLVSGEGGRVVELSDDKFVFLMPGLDRVAANRIGQEILRGIRQWSSIRQQTGRIGLTLSLGCVSTDVPAPNLKAAALIEAAARCLESVQRSAGNGLKSIDIYY